MLAKGGSITLLRVFWKCQCGIVLYQNLLAACKCIFPAKKKKKKATKASNLARKKLNYLFADDIILYVENPKDTRKKKMWELINNFNKVTEHKINIQKPVSFLYITMNNPTKETKKTTLYQTQVLSSPQGLPALTAPGSQWVLMNPGSQITLGCAPSSSPRQLL